MGFLGPPGEPIKLPSPLIGILSEFSSSWKVPNVDSRLWLLQGHNLSTIVYYTMKSAKLSNTIYLHKCFIQCTGLIMQLDFEPLLQIWSFMTDSQRTKIRSLKNFYRLSLFFGTETAKVQEFSHFLVWSLAEFYVMLHSPNVTLGSVLAVKKMGHWDLSQSHVHEPMNSCSLDCFVPISFIIHFFLYLLTPVLTTVIWSVILLNCLMAGQTFQPLMDSCGWSTP